MCISSAEIFTRGMANMKILAVSIKFALLSRYKLTIVKIDAAMSVNFTA